MIRNVSAAEALSRNPTGEACKLQRSPDPINIFCGGQRK